MSLLPEEFAVILTVFFALGAWRIAKKKVLTKDLSAIETLGAATTLCVDKTGTITFNKMSVEKLYFQDEIFNTQEDQKFRLMLKNYLNMPYLLVENRLLTL